MYIHCSYIKLYQYIQDLPTKYDIKHLSIKEQNITANILLFLLINYKSTLITLSH